MRACCWTLRVLAATRWIEKQQNPSFNGTNSSKNPSKGKGSSSTTAAAADDTTVIAADLLHTILAYTSATLLALTDE